MTTNNDIKLKELDIELEKVKIKLEKLRDKRMDKYHLNRMEELSLRKEIAILYRSKKQLNKIKKEEKKINVN